MDDRVIDKQTFQGTPFWRAFHFNGFYYEMHINKIKKQIALVETPQVKGVKIIEFDEDFDSLVESAFDSETLKEVKQFIL